MPEARVTGVFPILIPRGGVGGYLPLFFIVKSAGIHDQM